MYVQFFPTFSCNAGCSFCFNRGISSGPDIKAGEFRALADILSAEGITEIDILGGEPTLHPELNDIIKTSIDRGMPVSLSSNGTNVGVLRELSRTFDVDSLTIGISIGPESVSEGLRRFILDKRPLLKSVCTRDRFLPAGAMEFLETPGMRYYAIFMDALCPPDLNYSLSFHSYFGMLKEHKSIYGNIEGVYCSCFMPDAGADSNVERTRCPGGTTKISVMPDGSVYPCYLLFRWPQYRAGNILRDPFDKIMQSPALDIFRSLGQNVCGDKGCSLHGSCLGGCPAVSLSISGDLHRPDPRCAGLPK